MWFHIISYCLIVTNSLHKQMGCRHYSVRGWHWGWRWGQPGASVRRMRYAGFYYCPHLPSSYLPLSPLPPLSLPLHIEHCRRWFNGRWWRWGVHLLHSSFSIAVHLRVFRWLELPYLRAIHTADNTREACNIGSQFNGMMSRSLYVGAIKLCRWSDKVRLLVMGAGSCARSCFSGQN